MKKELYEKFKNATKEYDAAKEQFELKKNEIFRIVEKINIEDVASSLIDFYKEIEKLDSVLKSNITFFNQTKKHSQKTFRDFLRNKKIKLKDHKYSVPSKHLDKFDKLYYELKNTDDYIFLSFKSFIINATSLFDSYILSTITNLKAINKDLLFGQFKKNKDKIFSYADICSGKYGLLEYEQKYITKHLVSDNRVKQIKWLLSLLGKHDDFPLKKPDDLKTFIEFTEIRNLLVHNQGKINNLFLENLKKNNIDTEKYKLYHIIEFKEKDMEKYKNVLLKTVAIFHAFVCNYITKECKADIKNYIDELTVRLLKNKSYNLCQDLIQEYLNLAIRDHQLDDVLKINLAIIFKIKHYNVKLKNICGDVKSTECQYLLAKAILMDDNDEIYKQTLDVNIPKSAFYMWPIFNFVKNNKIFLNAFKEKYKEAYIDEIIEKDD